MSLGTVYGPDGQPRGIVNEKFKIIPIREYSNKPTITEICVRNEFGERQFLIKFENKAIAVTEKELFNLACIILGPLKD